MIKLSLTFLFSLVLSSCAVINEPYYYNEVVLRNNTNELLTDVKIQSMKTNRMISCANISPGSQCSDKFAKRKYQQAKLSISWTYRGQRKHEDNIVLVIPENMSRDIPLRGVLIVNKDGTLTIFVEPGQP